MISLRRWDQEWVDAIQKEIDPILEAAKERQLARSPEDEAREMQALLDEPMDPDIEQISGYLTLDMPAEEMAAVEDRLANDPEFRKKVAPLIWMWDTPISFTPPSERGEEPRAFTAKPVATGEEIEFVAAKPIKRRMRIIIILAIVVPLLVGVAGWFGLKWMTKTISRAVASGPIARGVGAPHYLFPDPRRYVAGEGPRTVNPRPGFSFELSKGTYLTVRGDNRNIPYASVNGEAVVTIAPSPSIGRIAIVTGGGWVFVTPGRYAIRCPGECKEALVTIDSGTVTSIDSVAFTDGLVAVTNLTIRRPTDTTGFFRFPRK